MTNQADRFDLHLTDALGAYAASGIGDTDAYVTADAMLAARHGRRTRWTVAGIGAVLAAAVLAGIVIGGITQPLPDVGPSASASAALSPTVAPSASPPAPEALPGGTFAITTVEVPVYAEPAAGEPFFTLAGQIFYIRGSRVAPDGSLWHEVQFVGYPFGGEWIFGWIPAEIDGQDVIIPQDPEPCPTAEEFANSFPPAPPRLPVCLEQGTWTITGFLIRVRELAPYVGEPAWLVGPSEWALSGAIGGAVTSWQLPLYFDPNPEFAIDIEEEWISDREAHEGLRVWVQGRVAHPAARECRLTATDPALADPTELQAIDFCQQRFIVTSLRQPGFAEPPGSPSADLDLRPCDNPGSGYRVSVPGSWFTTDDAESGPCSLFSPDGPPSGGDAAIELRVFDDVTVFFFEPSYLAYEELDVGGFRATRSEVLDEGGTRVYQYDVRLGDGLLVWPTLLATTTDAAPGDYATNRLILDVMMRSLELLPAE